MTTGIILVIGLGAAVVALVWFFFIAPMEKQMHDRRMEMIKRKIAKRKTQLQEQAGEKPEVDGS